MEVYKESNKQKKNSVGWYELNKRGQLTSIQFPHGYKQVLWTRKNPNVLYYILQ